MNLIKIILVALTLSSCSIYGMGAKPPFPRTCEKYHSWELETKPCLLRLSENDEVIKVCPGEPAYPPDVLGVTIERLNCERDYQDTLVRKCKKWRK